MGKAKPPWLQAKNKYRAKRTEYNGRTYASKAEATRAMEHDARCATSHGDWVLPQVRIVLADGIPYTVDFLCGERTGSRTLNSKGRWEHFIVYAEDVKGMEKQRDRDIQRLWAAGHGLPIPLVILKRKGGKWERKVIEPKLGC